MSVEWPILMCGDRQAHFTRLPQSMTRASALYNNLETAAQCGEVEGRLVQLLEQK